MYEAFTSFLRVNHCILGYYQVQEFLSNLFAIMARIASACGRAHCNLETFLPNMQSALTSSVLFS